MHGTITPSLDQRGARIEVLDHGFVRLVDHMGSDLSIARAARVSYAAAWRAGEDKGSDAKLIGYLLEHAHTSPFEHVVFTFEVKAPIFVLRQWHRHRTQSFSEASARYVELPEEFYVAPPEEIGKQSKKNNQMRDAAEPDEIASEMIRARAKARSRFTTIFSLAARRASWRVSSCLSRPTRTCS